MARTKAEIRDRALRKLGRLALGQVAESNLAAEIEEAYDQVFDELKSENLVTWTSESVPNEFAEPVASLVAFARSEGVPTERYQRIAVDALSAKMKIAGLINGTYSNPRDYTDY